MRRGYCTFRPDKKEEDRHSCFGELEKKRAVMEETWSSHSFTPDALRCGIVRRVASFLPHTARRQTHRILYKRTFRL